jgi:2-amino-4-hydroxy-6-hydroxymethyldihydropteridine diphosphokinase
VILIALGANLSSAAGEPLHTLRVSLSNLSQKGVRPVSVSRAFETPAWPNPADPPFVNAVAAVETALDPAALMAELHRQEEMFGRVRSAANAPRTLDLDLIDYAGRVETGALTLPHPRMASRGFVLIPLADIAPDWRHPVSGKRVSDLIAALADTERASIVPLGPLQD